MENTKMEEYSLSPLPQGQDNKVAMVNEDTGERFIADLTSRKTSFCSLEAVDQKGKATLFKAMNNPEKRISDCINEVIEVMDVFVEVVTCHDDVSGKETRCPRIVLIDKNGVGYQAVSLGVFSAVKKLFQVFGTPTWAEPLKLKVRQIKKGTKSLLTFDVL